MAKRGAGEGTFRQRPDGTWEGRITVNSRRRSIYAKSYKECQSKLNAARRAAEQGLPLVDERLTVEKFLKRWLEDSVKASTKPRTYGGYCELVRLHIGPALGHVKLAKLSPGDIQGFLNAKLKEGLAPASVVKMHAVIRRSLGQAEKWGLVARNVAKLVDPPRIQRDEVRPLTPEQARAFLEAAKGDRFEALYSVALALGLRLGEALALKWQDVDLDSHTLRVRHTLRWGGGWHLEEPKSARSRRTISLPQSAVAALKEHRKRQLEDRVLAGSRWQDHDFIFTTSIGTPLQGGNIARRSFKPLLKKAGLPDIRFHDLRHTAASLLLAQGIQPRVVMEILGHSQIGLTMNTYSHVMPALQQEAAAKMDAILSGDI